MTPERYAVVKKLFSEAVDLEPEKRATFLAERCGGDSKLRNDVESLLEHDDPRTLIRSADQTLLDFPKSEVTVASGSKIPKQLLRIGPITSRFGPQGTLAFGGMLSSMFLVMVGVLSHFYLDQLEKDLRRDELTEIVDGKVLALRIWLEQHTQKAESWARSTTLRSLVVKLAEESSTLRQEDVIISASEKDVASIRGELFDELASLSNLETEFSIWNRKHELIATSFEAGDIDRSATPWGSSVLASVFQGSSRVFCFGKERSIRKLDGSFNDVPRVAIVSPILHPDGDVIAALQLHDIGDSEGRFLMTSQFGKTGCTYLFRQDGSVVAGGRLDQSLRWYDENSHSFRDTPIEPIYLRDPGGNLTSGFRPDEPMESRPLTRMARLCVSRNDGSDMEGYRNYQGVMVVGAWRWLDDLNLGIAAELESAEATPGMRAAKTQSRFGIALIAFCLAATVFSFYSINRIRQSIGENDRLGQYILERQIGEGGMGTVFKGRHGLLKRPTAIKLLKPDLLDEASIARFEREAQLVSRLEHFNTIRVFDYGVTPERIFYLVMEYIDGFSFTELVDFEGEISPQRTVYLLRQICMSLREAHGDGLVHRDLKPSNVMVCQRGGEADVVKVLDFGLVKPIETNRTSEITSTGLIAGTPQYIAPERVSDPLVNDPRSDLFALGAVAFFLLTGRNAVLGNNLAEVIHHLVNVPPRAPSEESKQTIPSALDSLVLRCLAKSPKERPQSAEEIIAELDHMEFADIWTPAKAQAWWDRTRRFRSRN